MSVYIKPGHSGVNDSSITEQVPNGRGGTKSDAVRAGSWHSAPFVKGTMSRNRTEVWDLITSP
jgi:N-acetylmuramoyl-L-alanine amidase